MCIIINMYIISLRALGSLGFLRFSSGFPTLRRLIIVPGGLITRTGRGLGGAFGGPGGAFGGPGGGFESGGSGKPLLLLRKRPPGPPKAPPGPQKTPPRPLMTRVTSHPGTTIKHIRVRL